MSTFWFTFGLKRTLLISQSDIAGGRSAGMSNARLFYVGQIDPKWDKSVTFSDHISPIWGQSDPAWADI